nr:hypothetical protein [Tanacetum cinerariifolium]
MQRVRFTTEGKSFALKGFFANADRAGGNYPTGKIESSKNYDRSGSADLTTYEWVKPTKSRPNDAEYVRKKVTLLVLPTLSLLNLESSLTSLIDLKSVLYEEEQTAYHQAILQNMRDEKVHPLSYIHRPLTYQASIFKLMEYWMMLDSIDNGLLVYPTIKENGQTRPMKYSELIEAQQLQDDCNVQAANIILYSLPPDVYAFVNHQEAAKDIWDRGETLYEYYWRFSQLINDMHTIGITMQQVQVNTKSLNALPSEWSKFVTDVKLAKSLYTTKYLDPLALVPSSPTLYNLSQSSQHLGLHTKDLDAYDSDCDDLSSAKAILKANLLSCDPEVLSEVSYSDSYLNDMINQDVQEM